MSSCFQVYLINAIEDSHIATFATACAVWETQQVFKWDLVLHLFDRNYCCDTTKNTISVLFLVRVYSKCRAARTVVEWYRHNIIYIVSRWKRGVSSHTRKKRGCVVGDALKIYLPKWNWQMQFAYNIQRVSIRL